MPGMIFVKRVIEEEVVQSIKVSDKYEKYRWIDIVNMELEKEDCVDNFKENVEKAKYLLESFDFDILKNQIAQTSQ